MPARRPAGWRSRATNRRRPRKKPGKKAKGWGASASLSRSRNLLAGGSGFRRSGGRALPPSGLAGGSSSSAERLSALAHAPASQARAQILLARQHAGDRVFDLGGLAFQQITLRPGGQRPLHVTLLVVARKDQAARLRP